MITSGDGALLRRVVVGGGTMGVGIAHALAAVGAQVTVVEAVPEDAALEGRVLGAQEVVAGADAVRATHTSALSAGGCDALALGSTSGWASPSTSWPPSAPGSSPRALLRDMVARGELGQKSGRGFYSWD